MRLLPNTLGPAVTPPSIYIAALASGVQNKSTSRKDDPRNHCTLCSTSLWFWTSSSHIISLHILQSSTNNGSSVLGLACFSTSSVDSFKALRVLCFALPCAGVVRYGWGKAAGTAKFYTSMTSNLNKEKKKSRRNTQKKNMLLQNSLQRKQEEQPAKVA